MGWLAFFMALTCALSVVGLAVWLPEWAVTAWAIVATFSIPFVALAGWRFGFRDSSLTQSGVHLGIDTVLSAADKATQFRGRAGFDQGLKAAELQRKLHDQGVEETAQAPPVLLIEPGDEDQDILDL